MRRIIMSSLKKIARHRVVSSDPDHVDEDEIDTSSFERYAL